MKSFRRHSATVNAGSMADIAFLLLIFFLVTTTISAEKGILRQLPAECPPGENCTDNIHERNLLRISLNNNQEIMVEDNLVMLDDIKELVKSFVDNNGQSNCDYCYGDKLSESSDHPTAAVISLSHEAFTKHHVFISVQDEITKAFYDLRTRYIKEKLKKAPEQITDAELKIVKQAYPLKVSEVTIKRD